MTPQDVYAQLPTIACQGHCHATCGYIGAMPVELEQMVAVSGRRLVFYEATSRCGYLNEANRCDVYADRPLMCRAFGLVDQDGMRCPFGCLPDRWLRDDEAATLFAALGPEGVMAEIVR